MQRKLRILIGTAAAAGFLVASTLAANAAVIDFSGDRANLGTTNDFSNGGVSVTAAGFEVEKADHTDYTAADLFRRGTNPSEPLDLGIGVCNSDDAVCLTTGTGGGVTNEIDNNTNGTLYDVIRLDVSLLNLFTLTLSSLDGNDEAAIYGSDLTNPDLSLLTPIDADVGDTGGDNANTGEIDISSFDGLAFLYITTNLGDGNTGDDFLLSSLTATNRGNGNGGQEVPEPMTLGLLGLGLVGLGLVRRRRKAA